MISWNAMLLKEHQMEDYDNTEKFITSQAGRG